MNEHEQKSVRNMRRFRIMLSITVGAVLFLILVGGIVRSTGSGLGCPDWPKCFGRYTPPTDISQLPADYKEIFQVAGKEIADFDPFKTWVEYINRLIGVLIGFFALLTAFFSLFVYRIDRKLSWLSILALFLIMVQGGVGAIVVKTHLSTGMITLHMMLALVTLMLYIGTLLRSHRDKYERKNQHFPPSFWLWGVALLLLTLAQIVMGTQVREQVDIAAENLGDDNRALWLEALGNVYLVHKFFYYAVLASFLGWANELRRMVLQIKAIQTIMILLAGVLLAEIVFGLCMHHFAIPPVLQPLHLLFASLLIAGEFSILGIGFFAKQRSTH